MAGSRPADTGDPFSLENAAAQASLLAFSAPASRILASSVATMTAPVPLDNLDLTPA